ncbi:hypothetical protein HMPREF0793_1457 [Staphylococcus caprae M23864:W1]|uniref:Membrane spanning protein n=1 Tax=Staphylococcus caprae TaxID=29380 RepID=A0ABN5W553_9STAP|nr:hypothetical protein [Staphylococcus caprae]EES40770.1 hypothetical protein HMPREF0793_1457 [Staphylococcus caprae M23864:W1]OHO71014.1 hypothetical protein HMPREF2580_09415 [Staphylococcus sp. HMSC036D05]OHS36344.1 hypothetical protein HMPREF3264_09505 [Staphylococcus sp. HMSC62A08]MBX5319285.1 hypothetical protein [Staphylococcus caprae]MBX5322228.1 hypothetical protein [Staphylococcus caprae]
MADITESSAREIRAGRLIAISSFIFCILLIIHHFVVLDETTAKSLLSLAGQKTSDTAVHNILNSDRYTGVMYILAYLAGVVALWNRHPYLWWFMFAVYVSNALFTLVNLYMFVQAILDVKNVIAILPILIVVIGSIVLAIYMLVVSIARKSTFNR